MLLLFCYLPLAGVDFRKPGISNLRLLVDECGIDAVGQRQGLSVDAFSTDDKDLTGLGLLFHRLFQ